MAGVLAPIAARRGLLGLLLGLALAHFAHRQRRRAERAAGRALLGPTGFVDKLHATVALAHGIITQLQAGRVINSAEYRPAPHEWAEERRAWQEARGGQPTALERLDSLLSSTQRLTDNLLATLEDERVSKLLDKFSKPAPPPSPAASSASSGSGEAWDGAPSPSDADNDEGGRPAETPGSLARQPWSIAESLPPDESPAPLPPGLPPTSSTSSVRSRRGRPSQSPGRRASGLDKVSEIMEQGDRIVTKLLRTKSTVQMAIEQSGKISTDVEQSSRMCCCLVFLSIMLLLLILCSAMIYLEFVDGEAVQSHADAAVAAAGEYVPNGESLRAAIPFVPEPEPTSTYEAHRQAVKSWIAMSP